jgi:hypothetical protein
MQSTPVIVLPPLLQLFLGIRKRKEQISEKNKSVFKHSSRSFPLKLEMNPLSTGRPGRIKSSRTLF